MSSSLSAYTLLVAALNNSIDSYLRGVYLFIGGI